MAILTILSHHGMLWSVGKNEEETEKKKIRKKKKVGGWGGGAVPSTRMSTL